MKKEFLKLIFLSVVLSISIIILSGRPVIRTFSSTSQLAKQCPQNFYLTSLSDTVLKDAYSLQELFVQVAQKVKPAVVSISTVYSYEVPKVEFFFGDPFEEFFKDFFDFDYPRQRQKPKLKPRQYKAEGGGSGVLISPDGYILTNEHVIKSATEIKVLVNIDGKDKDFKGRVVGRDAKTDLAVIKIDGKNLPYAKLGDSDNVRVGEWVLAIGSPFGLEQTVTSGIVSARRQSITIEGRVYRDFIQTDAAINRGNSGGPLCNLNGEVIGINTAIYAPTGVFSGIGFAIPINRAKLILDDLIHKGKVTRGWLGIEIYPVDDVIAKQFGLKTKQGVIINSVKKNTPAEKSGLKRGDIILEVKSRNKTEVINSPTDLQDIISSLSPKEKVELKILRDKKEQTVTVILGEMPQDLTKLEEETSKESKGSKEEKEFVWLGYKFVNLDEQYVEKFRLESTEGVLVVDIDYKDKNFENIGLRKYDVILSINQQKVPDVSTLKQVLKKVNLKEGVVFDIIRDGRPMYISFSK
jgi:serine protease Do